MENFKNVTDLESFYKKFENKTLKDLSDYVSHKYPKI